MTITTTIQPASTYVRLTVDRLTQETRKRDESSRIWDYVHLLSIITQLDIDGHGAAIREAADLTAGSYGLPSQAEVEGLATCRTDNVSDVRCTLTAPTTGDQR